MSEATEKVKKWAYKAHEITNHHYGNQPYSFHLECVASVAREFIGEIPEAMREVVIESCYCHDLIEDARMTYNDVKKMTGETVAEIVFALTNEKGRNRKERANDKYYAGIRATPYATFVKLCDRIANVQESIGSPQNNMRNVYRNEFDEFKAQLYVPGEYEKMWERLAELLDV